MCLSLLGERQWKGYPPVKKYGKETGQCCANDLVVTNDTSINHNISEFLPDGCHSFIQSKGFKCAHLNIRSLTKHTDQLRWIMYNISPDVLSINETRLDSTVTDNAVCIDGYNVFRKDRNRLGGGVCLYVKCIHNACVRNDLLSDDLEAICVEVAFPKRKNLLAVSLYRPPSSCVDYLKHISNNFEAGLRESKHFNLDCGIAKD